MNDPVLQAGPERQEARLWDKAPAWRNLAVAASLLTLAAVATPLLLPGPPQQTIPPAAARPAPAPVAAAPAAPVPAPVEAAPMTAHRPARIASAPQDAKPAPACVLAMGDAPQHLGTATVVGFIDHAHSLRIFQQNGGRFGAPVNAAYLDYVRLLIHPDHAPNGVTRGTLVPAQTHIAVGDRVNFDSAYRAPGAACNWIPTLVTADLGPAPQASP